MIALHQDSLDPHLRPLLKSKREARRVVLSVERYVDEDPASWDRAAE